MSDDKTLLNKYISHANRHSHQSSDIDNGLCKLIQFLAEIELNELYELGYNVIGQWEPLDKNLTLQANIQRTVELFEQNPDLTLLTPTEIHVNEFQEDILEKIKVIFNGKKITLTVKKRESIPYGSIFICSPEEFYFDLPVEKLQVENAGTIKLQ